MRSLISDFIVAARRRLQLSQAALAGAIEVPRITVARWESGDRPVPVRHLASLSRALQLPDEGDLRALLGLTVDASCRSLGVSPGLPSPLALPYDNSKTPVSAMLALGPNAQSAQAWALDKLGPALYAHFVQVFPRDTVHELLAAHRVVTSDGKLILVSLLHLGCRLLAVEPEGPFSYVGDHVRPALAWRHGDESLVVFGQVTIAAVLQSRRYRADQLVCYRRGTGRAHWICVEFDGGYHAETANQDARRAAGLGTLEVRFENAAILRSDFFEMRYLREIRSKAQWAEQNAS